ncbi:hypothetical protein GCM10009665_59290 [Kitasatospora nipponensis]|uniref:Ricin-type beta-trefoil lectin protein n=1 Tax=Kitasatospora nipponensis TaxID=258049 RepID=A0ABP4HF48_9ACTN
MHPTAPAHTQPAAPAPTTPPAPPAPTIAPAPVPTTPPAQNPGGGSYPTARKGRFCPVADEGQTVTNDQGLALTCLDIDHDGHPHWE